ncbi:MAG: hypothetical protein EOM05_09045 [Clostridia bacterium]|nr:hypothetical protein [Clostridia bacterium]
MWLDSASDIDMLFYTPYADTIAKIVKDGNLTPLTIGLYGSWGAGKSSLLKIIDGKLQREEKIVCVTLNAWQIEGYEDAKVAIIEALLRSLNENETFLEKASGKIKELFKRINFLKLGTNIVSKGIPIAMSAISGNPLPIAVSLSAALSSGEDVVASIESFKDKYWKSNDSESQSENLRKFRKEFEEMLSSVSSISNLVVIIDDLDRCTPERIIETLEAIKLFLSVEKTTFIIAVDQRIIEYSVKTKYPQTDQVFDLSSDYIEKIIQIPIKIPELSAKDIENYLLLLIYNLHLSSETFEALINELYRTKAILYDVPLSVDAINKTLPPKVEYGGLIDSDINVDLSGTWVGNTPPQKTVADADEDQDPSTYTDKMILTIGIDNEGSLYGTLECIVHYKYEEVDLGAKNMFVSASNGVVAYDNIQNWDEPFILVGHANDNLEEYLSSAGKVWLENLKLDVVNKTITGRYRHSYGTSFDVTLHLSE